MVSGKPVNQGASVGKLNTQGWPDRPVRCAALRHQIGEYLLERVTPIELPRRLIKHFKQRRILLMQHLPTQENNQQRLPHADRGKLLF